MARQFSLVLIGLVLVGGAGAQQLESAPAANKVCVATVANASTTSAFVERLTDRLVKRLKQNKVEARKITSATASRGDLQPSRENGEESRDQACNYVLLTRIRDPRQHPFEARAPEVSIGGRVPSVDASDPLGGSSGPVYRDNLEVGFAVFPVPGVEALVNTVVLERASANVADTLLPAMDREANRISHELRKR